MLPVPESRRKTFSSSFKKKAQTLTISRSVILTTRIPVMRGATSVSLPAAKPTKRVNCYLTPLWKKLPSHYKKVKLVLSSKPNPRFTSSKLIRLSMSMVNARLNFAALTSLLPQAMTQRTHSAYWLMICSNGHTKVNLLNNSCKYPRI